jgi:tetratricopeptide (TPR) repeat protein
MTTNLLDWDEDLQANSEEEYEALLNGLRRSHGFALYFVKCSPFSSDKLIERVKKDLTEKNIAVLKLDQPIADGNFFKRVSTFWAEHKPLDVLFIQGFENSLFDAEETKKRLGWSHEKIETYTWRDVPPVLINLNQQRERFRDSFDTCFVFLLPQYAFEYIVHRAPDFFDWRSGVFEYASKPESLAKESSRILQEVDYESYCKWSSLERKTRILEIQALLDETNTKNEIKAKLFFEQGLIFGASNKNDLEILAYDKALNLRPRYYAALNCKGFALYELGKYEAAINCYDQALLIQPQSFYLLHNKGAALAALGNKEEAIDYYDQALKINPTLSNAWYDKGNALRALGRYEEAIAAYDQALAIKPDDHEALYNKGNALAALGRYEEAIAAYDQALALKPDKHEALYNKGNALAALGRYEEAIAAYDQALAIKPDKHEVLNSKGTALSALGRYEEAIAAHDKAIELAPEDGSPVYNKACCYGLQGDAEGALEWLKAAIALDPENLELAKTDTDFDPIRHDERFRALVAGGG